MNAAEFKEESGRLMLKQLELVMKLKLTDDTRKTVTNGDVIFDSIMCIANQLNKITDEDIKDVE